MNVKFKRLSDQAVWPKVGTPGSACFDLYAVGTTKISPNRRGTISTGLAFEIPPGHVMLLFSRSSMTKVGTRLANCVGVIDSDYRGEVMVVLANDGDTAVLIQHHTRVCQAMVIPVPALQLVEVDELSTTERGTGGFGSTGQA